MSVCTLSTILHTYARHLSYILSFNPLAILFTRMKTETEYSTQGHIVTLERPDQNLAKNFITLRPMFILRCFPRGPDDWMVRLIQTRPVMGAIEKTVGRGFLGLENHMCRQHSGCLSLESALEKRSYGAYYSGLFLVNFMQQCFWRECKDNKALFSPYPFLFQHRVQIHNTFPSIVGHSNFHALAANRLYQTSMHLIIFCPM